MRGKERTPMLPEPGQIYEIGLWSFNNGRFPLERIEIVLRDEPAAV